MRPILFSADATSFNTNGIGRLDCISCTVTEKRNGEYELAAEIAEGAMHAGEIAMSSIILATHDNGSSPQPFRVYKITKPINGRFGVYAQHISYQLSCIPAAPFTAGSAAAAMAGLKTNAMADCPFTFWTDKETAAKYSQDVPASIRSQLGGVSGSILDVYGGEYEFDNYTVKLHNNRGQDRGVSLRYGKNITDIEQEENIASTYTSIVGYWKNDESLVQTAVIDSEYASAYPFKRVKVVDFSSEYEEAPTVATLTARAASYMAANDFGIPKVSIDVSFAALWQTEEYKDIAPLERVYLCDTVTVEFERLGISAKAKVVKTVYNVLLDRYDKIEVGDARTNLSDRIASQSEEIRQAAEDTLSELEKAISRATEMITGQKGGYIVDRYNADGERYEMLIMDTNNVETARKVWRWNLSGWGYSSTGIGGPYTLAATQDGEIVADFITAGTLTANIIQAGVLASIDKTKNFSLDMLTGKIKMADGEFSGTITGSVIQSAKEGARILMDTSSSVKGMSGDKMHNLINMAQTVSGSTQMTIDADTQLNIRTPKLSVIDQSYGTGSATVKDTATGSYSYVTSVGKYVDDDHGKDIGVESSDDYDIYCHLPVYLSVGYEKGDHVLGMKVNGSTSESKII